MDRDLCLRDGREGDARVATPAWPGGPTQPSAARLAWPTVARRAPRRTHEQWRRACMPPAACPRGEGALRSRAACGRARRAAAHPRPRRALAGRAARMRLSPRASRPCARGRVHGRTRGPPSAWRSTAPRPHGRHAAGRPLPGRSSKWPSDRCPSSGRPALRRPRGCLWPNRSGRDRARGIPRPRPPAPRSPGRPGLARAFSPGRRGGGSRGCARGRPRCRPA
jgi:hypothetical protein